MTREETREQTEIFNKLRDISAQDFLALGKEQVAYVRPVKVDGKKAYAVHAADGTPMIVLESYNSAMNMLVREDMVPATLH